MSTRHARAGVIAAAMLVSLAATAQAATGEVQVPFDSVPTAVQGALTDYGSGVSNGATASVWQGVDRGHVVYTGRIVDIDGSSRIIDVDEVGRVSALHQFAAPIVKFFDPGQTVAWASLTPGAQKTIADNSRGARVTEIVRKKAANGMTINVAATVDAAGQPVYIETTTDGTLIGLKRRPD